VFKVADLKISCQFYSNLGLPPFAIFEDDKVAIVELRGGTHLLLLEGDQLADMAESVTGQFHNRLAEQFDLMIKGKGHHLFSIKDPDGNGITIYTSHEME
jgi:catechol-2,3-dioxygenase